MNRRFSLRNFRSKLFDVGSVLVTFGNKGLVAEVVNNTIEKRVGLKGKLAETFESPRKRLAKSKAELSGRARLKKGPRSERRGKSKFRRPFVNADGCFVVKARQRNGASQISAKSLVTFKLVKVSRIEFSAIIRQRVIPERGESAIVKRIGFRRYANRSAEERGKSPVGSSVGSVAKKINAIRRGKGVFGTYRNVVYKAGSEGSVAVMIGIRGVSAMKRIVGQAINARIRKRDKVFSYSRGRIVNKSALTKQSGSKTVKTVAERNGRF